MEQSRDPFQVCIMCVCACVCVCVCVRVVFQILTSGLTVPTIEAEFDEFYKADGCLTCCSILLQSP